MLTLSSPSYSILSSSSSFIETFFSDTFKLNTEFKHYRLSKNPLSTPCEGSWKLLLMTSCSLAAVGGILFSWLQLFYLVGVLSGGSINLIFLLIVASKSSRSLMKLGWLKMLLALSLRDLWNPYMLSWRMKLLIFLCRKYLGRTIYWNLLISLMIKSLPEGPQNIILPYS